MRRTMLLMCLLLAGALTHESSGQTATFKALFLFNFTKNIDWPPQANGNELVVTVLGDDEITSELEKIAKVKKAGNKSIKVVKAKTVKEVNGSHVVFLGSAKSALMSSLSHSQSGKPVLLVADKGGLCKDGAGISFLTVNGKLRYEISRNQIESHQLKVTQKVISLGIEVQ